MQVLLGKEEKAEEDRWRTLTDAQLDEEVQLYRAGVQALSDELAQRGLSNTAAEGPSHANLRHIPGIEVHPLHPPPSLSRSLYGWCHVVSY